MVEDVFEIRMFGVVEFSEQLLEPPTDGGVELVHQFQSFNAHLYFLS